MESPNNIFMKLPEDAICEIFIYLNIYDLLNFCEAYPQYTYLLQGNKIRRIATLDFSMKFNLNISLVDTLKPQIDPSSVTVFNINGLYWIPSKELRSCISQFSNLEILCVLDTNMCVSEADALCLASLAKIRKIAINMNKLCLTQEAVQYFPAVKSLMLYMVVEDDTFAYIRELASKPCTKDLWVISKWEHNKDAYDIVHKMNLQRFVHYNIIPLITGYRDFQSSLLGIGSWPSIVPLFIWRSFRYINIDCGVIHMDHTQSRNRFTDYRYDTHFRNFMSTWLSNNYPFPHGAEDTKMILEEDPSYRIKELNFKHSCDHCTSKYFYGMSECLQSPLTSNLQKLSFKCCFHSIFRVLKLEEYTAKFEEQYGKEKKNGGNEKKVTESDPAKCTPHVIIDHPLNKLGINFPNLRELAIFQHCSSSVQNFYFNYESISKLKHLRKLTLCVLAITPPPFIVDILQECTKLEVLKIDCIENEAFMDHLPSVLKFAKKLKDFRYEMTGTRLNVDGLFEGLNERTESQLERLAVIADKSYISNRGYIEEFMRKNQQLVFVCLFIKDMPRKILRKINDDLMRYEMANFSTKSRKLFRATESLNKIDRLLPEVHRREMLYSPTNLSTRDICNEFMLPYPVI